MKKPVASTGLATLLGLTQVGSWDLLRNLYSNLLTLPPRWENTQHN